MLVGQTAQLNPRDIQVYRAAARHARASRRIASHMTTAYNRRMTFPHYTLDAELMLRVGDALLANAKRIELLRQIGLTENLTRSAKIAGYSYKGAWDTIDQMTQLTGSSLLERRAGGKGGGRTKLTERGRQLLDNFLLIQAEHERFIGRLNKLANGLDENYALQTEIAMKTSARNQFAGIVLSILQGPVNDEVMLMVNGNLMLTASITHESGRELGLDIGGKVFALIKASAVLIEPAAGPTMAAGPNRFVGTLHKLITGQQRSEAAIVLDGGTELVCTLDNGVVEQMGLVPGMAVVGSVAASNVILGVAA